jgi:hypothetical protein
MPESVTIKRNAVDGQNSVASGEPGAFGVGCRVGNQGIAFNAKRLDNLITEVEVDDGGRDKSDDLVRSGDPDIQKQQGVKDSRR